MKIYIHIRQLLALMFILLAAGIQVFGSPIELELQDDGNIADVSVHPRNKRQYQPWSNAQWQKYKWNSPKITHPRDNTNVVIRDPHGHMRGNRGGR
jgi:hypothetical protein